MIVLLLLIYCIVFFLCVCGCVCVWSRQGYIMLGFFLVSLYVLYILIVDILSHMMSLWLEVVTRNPTNILVTIIFQIEF
jgi:hypothetical protein